MGLEEMVKTPQKKRTIERGNFIIECTGAFGGMEGLRMRRICLFRSIGVIKGGRLGMSSFQLLQKELLKALRCGGATDRAWE